MVQRVFDDITGQSSRGFVKHRIGGMAPYLWSVFFEGLSTLGCESVLGSFGLPSYSTFRSILVRLNGFFALELTELDVADFERQSVILESDPAFHRAVLHGCLVQLEVLDLFAVEVRDKMIAFAH